MIERGRTTRSGNVAQPPSAAGQVRPGGFTLVEVLIVVAVIGVLMALMMGVAKEVVTQSYIKETKMKLLSLSNRAKIYQDKYKILNNGLPNGTGQPGAQELTQAWIQAGFAADSEIGAMVGQNNYINGQILDSWRNPIQYYYVRPSTNNDGTIKDIGSIPAGSDPQTGKSVNYNAVYRQNNGAPLLVSAGPNLTFNGQGDGTASSPFSMKDDITCPEWAAPNQ